MKTMFMWQLSEEMQDEILKDLREVLDDEEDIERAMSSRLCDLEDTINIEKYLLKHLIWGAFIFAQKFTFNFVQFAYVQSTTKVV